MTTRKSWTRDRGAALAMVLVVAAVLSILAYTLSSQGVQHAFLASRTRHRHEAFQAAQGGFRHALLLLRGNQDWTTLPQDPAWTAAADPSPSPRCSLIDPAIPNFCYSFAMVPGAAPVSPTRDSIRIRAAGWGKGASGPLASVALEANLYRVYPQTLLATIYGKTGVVAQGRAGVQGRPGVPAVVSQDSTPSGFTSVTAVSREPAWGLPAVRLRELIAAAKANTANHASRFNGENGNYVETGSLGSGSGGWIQPHEMTGLAGVIVFDARAAANHTVKLLRSSRSDRRGGRSPGVLVVLGDLELRGNLDYFGVIYVTGRASIAGSVTLRGGLLANEVEVHGGAGIEIAHDQRAVANFLTTAVSPDVKVGSVEVR